MSDDQKTEAELVAELHKSIEQELIAYFRVGGIYKSVGSARWALYANSTDVGSYRFALDDKPIPNACRTQETFMVLEEWRRLGTHARAPPSGSLRVLAGNGMTGYLLIDGGVAEFDRHGLKPWSDAARFERIDRPDWTTITG